MEKDKIVIFMENLPKEKRKKIELKFWSRTTKRKRKNTCWNWKGYIGTDGYGVYTSSFGMRAHRLAYYFFFKELPKNKLICHHCDNPKCVNPNHLFIGTNRDNTKDMFLKKRNGKIKGKEHPTQQGEKNHQSKLNQKQVEQIKRELFKTCNKKHKMGKQKELAERFNVSCTLIRYIKTGKAWPHVLPECTLKPLSKIRCGEDNNKAKLTEKEVLQIKKILKKNKKTISGIAKQFNVSRFAIQQINKGNSWKCLNERKIIDASSAD
jgi:hypothetical protein